MTNPYIDFANQLLPATVENALRSPFYSRLYSKVAPQKIDVDTLRHLPLIDRGVVQNNIEELSLVGELEFDELTTGGTSGKPLIFPVTSQEKTYIRDFSFSTKDGLGSCLLKRAIHLKAGTQLNSVGTQAPMRCHVINIYDNGSFDHAHQILEKTYCESGVEQKCTVIIGEEMLIRAFTLDCQKRRGSINNSTIRLLICYGDILTPRWRSLYRNFWSAEVIDRYGLTEAYGGATQAPSSEYYFYDPQCYIEVIGLKDKKRITEGLGELVLTPLYPFQQAFPLVRYRSGDLVFVTYTCPEQYGVPAIRPAGRLSTALLGPSGEVLPGIVFYLAIDRFPNASRTQPFLDAWQLSSRALIGRPKYKADLISNRVSISLETLNNQAINSQDIEFIKNALHEEYEHLLGTPWPKTLEIDVDRANLSLMDKPSLSP